jgi:hypothetical protein
MLPHYRDVDEPFEFRHMHACPCGTSYTCYLMACRERLAEPCFPCQLRAEFELRRRARAAVPKAGGEMTREEIMEQPPSLLEMFEERWTPWYVRLWRRLRRKRLGEGSDR